MKVADLLGAELDYWTGRTDGIPASELSIVRHQRGDEMLCLCDGARYAPSTDWVQSGQIIEKNWIGLDRPSNGQTTPVWRGIVNNSAKMFGIFRPVVDAWGETALIAAMRAYVTSKYGDEVPDEAQP